MTDLSALWADFDAKQAAADAARQRLVDALQGKPSKPERHVVRATETESESTPGIWHVTRRYSDGTVDCTCSGFRFRKYCRHEMLVA